eukprot:12713276-Ditylum_brightwellii.AAC.1
MEAPNRLHTGHLHHQHGCKILHIPPCGISPGGTREKKEGQISSSLLGTMTPLFAVCGIC